MKTGMTRKIALLLMMVILLASAGCKPSEKQPARKNQVYITVAREKLGDNVTFRYNDDRAYVLAQSEQPKSSNDLSFRFIVFGIKQEKVVLEQDVESGFVKWLSNTEIEVFRTPGKMRNEQTRDDYTMVYNVMTGDSMPKTEWKKK